MIFLFFIEKVYDMNFKKIDKIIIQNDIFGRFYAVFSVF